jgi:hypothetical protein
MTRNGLMPWKPSVEPAAWVTKPVSPGVNVADA